MNIRLLSVAAALAVGLAVPATSAFAQDARTFTVMGLQVTQAEETPRSFFGMPAWVDRLREGDPQTTGSVAPRRAYRGVDSSAKGGNAAQQDRLVPQYGNTSGGPAY